MIMPRLKLLECVELRSGEYRGRAARTAFLGKLGITEERFNDLVGGRADPTEKEKKALLAAIPESESELFRYGPADRTVVRSNFEKAVKR